MTIRCVLVCENCGTQVHVESRQVPERWGVLVTGDRERDICPGCIARLGGWTPHVPVGAETA